MADEQERTEEATQQRRDDFRRRGQVAQTRELGSAVVLLGAALSLWFLGRYFLGQLFELSTQLLSQSAIAGKNGDLLLWTGVAFKKGIMIIVPLCGIFLILNIAASLMQTGLLNNEEAFDFNFDRLNPIQGLQKLFSLKAIVEGIKSTLKLLFVAAAAYWLLRDQIKAVHQVGNISISQMLQMTGSLSFRLFAGLGIILGLIALADYFYQRWDLEKQMRMTKQEVKEEHKAREGDPLIKARIRRIQREMANKRMMNDVPKADVIITNPTHLACALKYYPEKMTAPQLVAKGSGLIAEKIKELARENSIPVIENKPLARTIFKTLKVGQIIPRELFAAVAQVLSYVYRLKKKAMRT